uniref:Uncharacterized protein n=1 Tax=Arundo donax TaxID=35708 RepID=A0A0A9BL98_ARUDO
MAPTTQPSAGPTSSSTTRRSASRCPRQR